MKIIAKLLLVTLTTLPLLLPISQSRAANSICASPKKNLILLLDARDSRSYSGSSTTWTDISGCGLDATFQGTGTPTKTLDNGGSLQFNRSNTQWARTNSPGTLSSFTVAAYFKFDAYDSLECTSIISDSFDSGGTNIEFQIGTS